ncbi:hypothetical protein [Planobispora longispora]|nr:hypothetical protein [Planobispora longispora]
MPGDDLPYTAQWQEAHDGFDRARRHAGLTTLTMPAMQFLIFMRTDVYFVLQDVTGCRDPYGDASAYARHLARRVLRRPSDDPLPRASRPGSRRLRRVRRLRRLPGERETASHKSRKSHINA